MKKLLFLFIFLFVLVFELKVYSQTDSTQLKSPSSVSVNVDLMSRYIWRAIDFGASPSIQPSLTYSYKNLSVGTWASYSVTGNFVEIDLFASYTFKNFTLLCTDFFYPNELVSKNNYFNFKNENTAHTIEAGLKYANEKFPLYIAAYTFFYGADKKPNSTDNYYSSYIEMGYAFSVKDVKCELIGGITPAEGYYASKFSFVNLGITAKKNIPVSSTFSLPMKVSLISNPKNQNVYVAFGFSF